MAHEIWACDLCKNAHLTREMAEKCESMHLIPDGRIMVVHPEWDPMTRAPKAFVVRWHDEKPVSLNFRYELASGRMA